MTQTTVALNSQWLDSSVPMTAQAFSASGTLNGGAGGQANTTNALTNCTVTYWPNQWGYWWYPYDGPARPIKLGLSEIARLKAAAKRDAKLKAILEKFTDLIQVTVDFE
jgi:hypothetical protein